MPCPNIPATAFLLFAAVTTCSAQSPTTPERQGGPAIIVDRADSGIFPESWLTPEINANGELLEESERRRSMKIVTTALTKYPATVPSANLRTVYVVGRLEYNGVATGGTNSRNAVYIVNKGEYSSAVIEKIFHAEFSSILLRNFPRNLDEAKWRQINPPDFRYLGSGVQAVREKQASSRFQASLHVDGFLNEYSQASIEEDFNSFAGRLFMGDQALWHAVEHYPKLKAKAELTIEFYGKLDAGLTREFFQSLRRAEEPQN